MKPDDLDADLVEAFLEGEQPVDETPTVVAGHPEIERACARGDFLSPGSPIFPARAIPSTPFGAAAPRPSERTDRDAGEVGGVPSGGRSSTAGQHGAGVNDFLRDEPPSGAPAHSHDDPVSVQGSLSAERGRPAPLGPEGEAAASTGAAMESCDRAGGRAHAPEAALPTAQAGGVPADARADAPAGVDRHGYLLAAEPAPNGNPRFVLSCGVLETEAAAIRATPALSRIAKILDRGRARPARVRRREIDVPGLVLANAPEWGTDEWRAWRRTIIGASEIAMVAGFSPYGTALDLFNEKHGYAPPRAETPALRQGRDLEPLIAKWFEEDHPEYELRGDGKTSYRHPTEPWAVASPDRFVFERSSHALVALLQIKSASLYAEGWRRPTGLGVEIPGSIPDGFTIQTTQEMAVTGVPTCFVARFVQGRELGYYTVRYAEARWAPLAALGRAFVQRFLAPGAAPPALDGSDAAWTYIGAALPTTNEKLRLPAPEDFALLEKARKAQAAAKRIASHVEVLKQALAVRIGRDRGIQDVAKWVEVGPARVPAHERAGYRFLKLKEDR